MVDLKKFVAYFLVLASIASSAAFFLSGFLDTPAQIAAPQTSSDQQPTAPLVSQNAFVEKTPDTSPKVDIEPGLPPVIITDNLTDNVAQNLTREFFRANANGPQGPDGQPAVTLPSDSQITSGVIDKLASPSTAALVKLPTFGDAVQQNEITTTKDNSPEAFFTYLTALDKVFRDTILSNDFGNVMKGDPSFDAVSAAQLVYSRALYNLQAVPVPSMLSALHGAALTLVTDGKKFADIPVPDSGDPLKTMTVMQAIEPKIKSVLTADFEHLSSEYKKAQQAALLLPPGDTRSAIAKFFVPSAHAQFGVPVSTAVDLNSIGSYVSNYGSWLEQIWEFAKQAVKQTLKNLLIKVIEQEVIGWINGNGDPKFITDWTSVISIPYDRAGTGIVNAIAGVLCSGIGPNLRLAFQSSISITNRFGCTLNRVVNNLNRFAARFDQGGFPGFTLSLQQNYFIQSMEMSDAALGGALAAQSAKTVDVKSSGGFLGVKQCPTNYTKVEGVDECVGTLNGDIVKPITVTPGTAVGMELSQAIGATPGDIINAQDIAGLTTAIVDSAINRVIRESLLFAFSSPTQPNNSGQVSVSDLCAGLTGQQYQNCYNSTAGNGGANETAGRGYGTAPNGTTPDTVSSLPGWTLGSSTGNGVNIGFGNNPGGNPGGTTSTSTTPLICSRNGTPGVVTADPNGGVTLSSLAIGGDNTIYDWGTGGNGTPQSQTGAARDFDTYFNTNPGAGTSYASTTQSITVSNAGQTATCTYHILDIGAVAPTTSTLAVAKFGTGSGYVTAVATPSINCGTTCSGVVNIGDVVQVYATPDSSTSTFAGWGGECSGTGTCRVTITGNDLVTATFTAVAPPPPPPPTTATLTVTLAGTGTGTITSNPTGISCNGTTCSGRFTIGNTVTLTAAPGFGVTFTGWSNGCTGRSICSQTIAPLGNSVTATFTGGSGGSTLTCTPQSQTISAGGAETITISGGSPTSYDVYAPGAVPIGQPPAAFWHVIGTGAVVSAFTYNVSSTTPYVITVNSVSGGAHGTITGTTTCNVTVN